MQIIFQLSLKIPWNYFHLIQKTLCKQKECLLGLKVICLWKYTQLNILLICCISFMFNFLVGCVRRKAQLPWKYLCNNVSIKCPIKKILCRTDLLCTEFMSLKFKFSYGTHIIELDNNFWVTVWWVTEQRLSNVRMVRVEVKRQFSLTSLKWQWQTNMETPQH